MPVTGPAWPFWNLKQTSGSEATEVDTTTVLPVAHTISGKARAGLLLMERGVTTWRRSLRRITAVGLRAAPRGPGGIPTRGPSPAQGLVTPPNPDFTARPPPPPTPPAQPPLVLFSQPANT